MAAIPCERRARAASRRQRVKKASRFRVNFNQKTKEVFSGTTSAVKRPPQPSLRLEIALCTMVFNPLRNEEEGGELGREKSIGWELGGNSSQRGKFPSLMFDVNPVGPPKSSFFPTTPPETENFSLFKGFPIDFCVSERSHSE